MNIDVVGRVRPANRGDASANLHVDKFNVVKAQKQHFTWVSHPIKIYIICMALTLLNSTGYVMLEVWILGITNTNNCLRAWNHERSRMLVSHCGEYMANGLTNEVRHEFVMIANDRQTFVAFVSIRGRFCGVSNVMLVSPVANVWRIGLRKQFAINSQWSQSDRQTFVDVRKHSRSFMWCCEY